MRGVTFSRSDMPGALDEFALITQTALGHLTHELPQGADPRELLIASWSGACATGNVVERPNEVSFALNAPAMSSRHPLVATLKPNTYNPERLPWAVTYAGPDSHHKLQQLDDSTETPRNLYDFAYIPWPQLIHDVQERALPEVWGFDEGDTSILRSYLVNTYQRVAVQGKVLVSEEDGIAVFNSGLATPTYDDLLLCFKHNNRPRPSWRYAGLCVAGEKGLGKSVTNVFATFPTVATYVDDVSDLVMDDARELYADDQHILIDNIDRLPLDFLREELYDQPDMLALLDTIGDLLARNVGEQELDATYDTLRKAIEANASVFRRLKNTLRDAIDLARKRTRWNYRTAIPCYHPATNQMSLLIPLCLRENTTPDVALVVSLCESGSYQGETILTIRQAYLDARLICRPEEDWLTVKEP